MIGYRSHEATPVRGIDLAPVSQLRRYKVRHYSQRVGWSPSLSLFGNGFRIVWDVRRRKLSDRKVRHPSRFSCPSWQPLSPPEARQCACLSRRHPPSWGDSRSGTGGVFPAIGPGRTVTAQWPAEANFRAYPASLVARASQPWSGRNLSTPA